MKIIAFSDPHGDLPEIPECDIVCISGDIVPLDCQESSIHTSIWFRGEFLPWVESLKCDKVVFIAGNHDFYLEDAYKESEATDKLIYLRDSLVEVNGIKIYGTPWCPHLLRWAYYAHSEKLTQIFSNIPDNIDILLTHCPPKVGKVGTVLQYCWNRDKDFGCEELRDAIKDKNIKYVFSGHIHSGYHDGVVWEGKTLYNVSLKDEFYNIRYNFKVINI